MAYKVTFYSHGKVHSELVWAQNDLRDPRDDEYDNEHGDHYRLWRFMPDGRRVTSFRCRYGEWVSTAAVINLPPQPEELRELEELRVRVAAAEEAAAMNEMRAAEAERRSMELSATPPTCATASKPPRPNSPKLGRKSRG